MANVSFSADDTIHKPLEVGEILAGDSSTNAFDETMKFVVEKEKTEAGKITNNWSGKTVAYWWATVLPRSADFVATPSGRVREP